MLYNLIDTLIFPRNPISPTGSNTILWHFVVAYFWANLYNELFALVAYIVKRSSHTKQYFCRWILFDRTVVREKASLAGATPAPKLWEKKHYRCRPSQNAVKRVPKCTIKAKLPKIPPHRTLAHLPLIEPHKKTTFLNSNNPAIRQQKFKDA